MTTDRKLWLILLPVVALGWIGVLALVMRPRAAAPSALVLQLPDGFAASLPAGISITAGGPFSLTLRAERPGLVAALYALGAPLVLPAGLSGCLPGAGV